MTETQHSVVPSIEKAQILVTLGRLQLMNEDKQWVGTATNVRTYLREIAHACIDVNLDLAVAIEGCTNGHGQSSLSEEVDVVLAQARALFTQHTQSSH